MRTRAYAIHYYLISDEEMLRILGTHVQKCSNKFGIFFT